MEDYKALLLAFLASENHLMNDDIEKVGTECNVNPADVQGYMKQLVANKSIMMAMLMGKKIEQDFRT